MTTLPLARYAVTATAARTVAEATAITVVLLGAARGVSEAQLGLIVACWTFPQFLTAPLVGMLADRAERPATWLAGLAGGGAAGLMIVSVALGRTPIAVLVAGALLIACAEPAIMGALSGLATRSAPAGLEAWDALTYGVAAIAAQGAVAALVWAAGEPAAAAAIAALGVGAAALLATLPLVAAHRGHGRARPWHALSLVGRDRELRSITLLTTVSMSAFGGVALVAVDLAEAHGRERGAATLLLLAMAIGAVVGSLVWTRVVAPARPMRHAMASVAVVAACFAACSVGGWVVCLVAFGVAGVADGPLLVATFTTRNRRTPDAARASVYTVSASLKVAATSLGAVLIGLTVATERGVSAPLAFAAVQVVALVAAAMSLRARQADAEPLP